MGFPLTPRSMTLDDVWSNFIGFSRDFVHGLSIDTEIDDLG